ncbi:hypothetical protein [Stenotrophomonas sp. 22385]|jgi:hypothetical protein|uniref:hypothetical protein n=1 Tax=Stenotrophomonas sp. 22385 TaxID=3453915 RepID=UPI003F87209F
MRRALRVALLMLLPAAAQAAAPSEPLAAQVNAQIVQRQVNEGVAAMAGASGVGMMPSDLPAACEPGMRSAVAGMSGALVRFMQGAFNDPAYQRTFEQQLAQAYSPAQLQAFLDRAAAGDLSSLSTEVMSAPGLQATQDAHLARLTEQADQAMEADPSLQKALVDVRAAQDRCDEMRMEADES